MVRRAYVFCMVSDFVANGCFVARRRVGVACQRITGRFADEGAAVVSPVCAEKPRQVRHEAQRLEILGAAAAAIAEHGFHGMTMRGLARATGRGLAT